ncbi:MAG: transporter substrate-binding domain-containing protein [Legionellaceae bacterium]|nr:transporter substrate-binding domain-containing protein [Legionellaceae bacterium]
MKQWITLGFFLIFGFFKTSGYAQSLIIGTVPANPPFSSQVDNKFHFMGFEIALMNQICNQLHVTCSYQPLNPNDVLSYLADGRIDMAIASIPIPNQEHVGLIFSSPYLPSNTQFMTLKTTKIYKLADIRNKVVGVRRQVLDAGKTYANFVKKMYSGFVTIKEYSTIPDLLAALNSGEIDVLFSNYWALEYWYYNHITLYQLIGDPIAIGNGYGLLTTEKHKDLIAQINEIISNMMNDGTYKKIYDQYFGHFLAQKSSQ